MIKSIEKAKNPQGMENFLNILPARVIIFLLKKYS
jgi:hypothetical protein